jgi:aminopeptidase N
MMERTVGKLPFPHLLSTSQIGRQARHHLQRVRRLSLGDSPWEGEMKHHQNRGCILLPAEMFQISAAKIMKLQIDEELLREMKDKIARDFVMQDVITNYEKANERIARSPYDCARKERDS